MHGRGLQSFFKVQFIIIDLVMITKYIYVITTLFCFISCTSSKFDYEIHGIMPSTDFDGELIYLVPLENPSPETVDSVKIVNGI